MTMDEINNYINMANEWSAKAMELVDSINKTNYSESYKNVEDADANEVGEASLDDEKNKLLQEDSNLADDLADLEKKLDEVNEKISHNNKEHKTLWGEYNDLSAKIDDICAKRDAIHKKWCEKFCKPAAVEKSSSSKNEDVKKMSKPKIPSTAKILECLKIFYNDNFTAADPYSSLNKLLHGKIETVNFISNDYSHDLYDIADILVMGEENKLADELIALADYYVNEKQQEVK